jgi:hypothetical protein
MTDLRVEPAAPVAAPETGEQAPPGRRGPGAATVAVAVVVAVGVLARFATGSALWLDEALSVAIARVDLADLPATLRRDGHPPLYYLLLHGWTSAFGDGDLAVRSLSGLFGLVTLPLAWLAARRVAGRAGAAAALVLVALSPFAVRYATEARMYTMVMALVFAGHLLVRDALDREPDLDGDGDGGVATAPRRLMGIAVVAGALYLTHYWAFYLGAATVAALAVVWRRDPRAWRRRAALRAGSAVVGGGVLFLPWLPSFWSQLGSTGTPWGTAPRPTVVFHMTLVDLGGPSAEGGLLAGLLLVLLSVGLFAVRPAPGDRTTPPPVSTGVELDLRTVPAVRGEVVVVVATLALGATVGFLTDAAFTSRYAAVVFPLLVVVAARGVAALRAPRTRGLVLAAVALLSGVGIYRNVTYDRTQAGQIAAAIAGRAGPDDVVITCPDQLGPALVRTLDQRGAGALGVVGYPTLERPVRVDWVGYEARNRASDPAAVAAQVLASVPADATVWLVTNTSYRTFEGRCGALEAVLGAGRSARSVLAADPGRFFETAELIAFSPTGGSARAPAGG